MPFDPQSAQLEFDPSSATPDEPAPAAAANPYAGNSFWSNVLAGGTKLATDQWLGARQALTQIVPKGVTVGIGPFNVTGGPSDALNQEAATKRAAEAPLMATAGGKVGYYGTGGAEGLGLSLIPGMEGYGGAIGIGALQGALQPTVGDESRATNTLVGGALGGAGKGIGDKVSSWLVNRSTQPFMGWASQFDRTLAEAAGSDRPALNTTALGAARARLSGIFNQVRSPNIETTLGQETESALNSIPAELNPSARAVFEANPNVADLMDALTSGRPITAQRLGSISTGLRQDASSMLNTEGGNRAAGLALRALRDHVDDVVGSTIQDPALAAAYTAARPQYSVLMDAIDNPTLLNASTGKASAPAWGRYLQRNDPYGYSNSNQSALYQGARWGQATGEGKGPPPLLKHFGLDWIGYRAMNNPVSNAIGGTVSNAFRPTAPAIRAGFPGIAAGTAPLLWPELAEQ